MRLLTFILAAVSIAPAQSTDELITTGGWFNIRKAPFESQVFAAVATSTHLVIGVSGKGGVEMVILDSTKFREVARWQLPRKPHYVTATSSSVILGYRSGDDAYKACAHSIDGRSQA